MAGKKYLSKEGVPVTGLYRVMHGSHRLPHEALLLAGEVFPRCARCSDQVEFELVAPMPDLEMRPHRIVRLYELPVLEEASGALDSPTPEAQET